MTLPRVSIVICNHNYGRFLAEAIESALAQHPPAMEVIVVDDGSTDDSVAIARRYEDRIQLLCQANGGQLAAYNSGLAAARGDAVVFLDSDDRLLPHAVARVAQALSDPTVTRVQYQLQLLDAQGRSTSTRIPSRMESGDLAHTVRQGRLFLASPGSGNAYRRSALQRLMPLPVTPEERHGADFFAGYGCALLGRVAALPEVLAEYRVHHANDAGQLCFGNARLGVSETAMLQSRYRRLKTWLASALPHEQLAPAAQPDFSIQKQDFAMAIFQAPGYLAGVTAGLHAWPALARSIWWRRGQTVVKPVLLAWAVAIWLAPRAWGWPLARHVCNPASRVTRTA